MWIRAESRRPWRPCAAAAATLPTSFSERYSRLRYSEFGCQREFSVLRWLERLRRSVCDARFSWFGPSDLSAFGPFSSMESPPLQVCSLGPSSLSSLSPCAPSTRTLPWSPKRSARPCTACPTWTNSSARNIACSPRKSARAPRNTLGSRSASRVCCKSVTSRPSRPSSSSG